MLNPYGSDEDESSMTVVIDLTALLSKLAQIVDLNQFAAVKP